MTPSDMGPLAELTRYFWASPKYVGIEDRKRNHRTFQRSPAAPIVHYEMRVAVCAKVDIASLGN
jgi:hypothetical protein